jgi:hypothetical protein
MTGTRRKALQIGLVLILVAIGFTVANPRWLPRLATATPATPTPAALRASAPVSTPAAVSMSPAAQPAPAVPAPRMVVAFRLDPALTRSLFLGDRWVSPPSFAFAQPGTQYVVRAKLQAIDSGGERTDLSGNWATTDPEMVAIDRGQGEVTIVVRQPGESDLTVTAGGASKILHVHARRLADAMQVAIDQ